MSHEFWEGMMVQNSCLNSQIYRNLFALILMQKTTSQTKQQFTKELEPKIQPEHSSKDLNLEEQAYKARCRFCLQEEGGLIRPCNCKGSIANVHERCIKEWIQVREERVFDTYYSNFRSMPCEVCQTEIQYEATIDRKCSSKQLKAKIKMFPGFFIAHSILLIFLLIPTVILTVLLLKTYKNIDMDSDVAPITIQSVFLLLTSMTFLKMLMIWLRDYALSNRINVLKVYQLDSPRPTEAPNSD